MIFYFQNITGTFLNHSSSNLNIASSNSSETLSINSTGYIDEGNPEFLCKYCGALLWYNERIELYKESDKIEFAICCLKRKIKFPYFREPRSSVASLFFDKNNSNSKHFLDNNRAFNNMFLFTSVVK